MFVSFLGWNCRHELFVICCFCIDLSTTKGEVVYVVVFLGTFFVLRPLSYRTKIIFERSILFRFARKSETQSKIQSWAVVLTLCLSAILLTPHTPDILKVSILMEEGFTPPIARFYFETGGFSHEAWPTANGAWSALFEHMPSSSCYLPRRATVL